VYLPPADAQETISIGFVETTPQARARADFPRAVLADHPGFDYLWFTDKVDRGDPCEAMQTLHRAPAAK